MRFLVLALLLAFVAVVCASPVLDDGDGAGKGKGKGRGKGKGGRGNGKRVSMGTLCEMSDDEIAKGEPLFARMHTFMDCFVANGLIAIRDCQVSAYGSEPSSLAELKTAACPLDESKQAALKTCMSENMGADKDKMNAVVSACKPANAPPGPRSGTPDPEE